MCIEKHIAFISGDERYIYLANIFVSKGYLVYTYGIESDILSTKCIKCDSINSIISCTDTIVFSSKTGSIEFNEFYSSVPLLTNKTIFGGNLHPKILDELFKYKIKFYDFFKVDYLMKLNSIATAEGCIMHAINSSIINICNSKSLVLGYGCCGSVLADTLYRLKSFVTTACRKPLQGATAISNGIQYISIYNLEPYINNFNFIFNTVPSLILNNKLLDLVSKDAILIDIATLPGGIDIEYAKSIGLNAHNYPGIPGKVSPLSSAYILYDYIVDVSKL